MTDSLKLAIERAIEASKKQPAPQRKLIPRWKVLRWFFHAEYWTVEDHKKPYYGGSTLYIRTWLFALEISLWYPDPMRFGASSRINFGFLPQNWKLKAFEGDSMYRRCGGITFGEFIHA